MIRIASKKTKGSSVIVLHSHSMSTLGALANFRDVVAALTHGARVISLRGSLSIHGVTAGDGPWLVGIANADLSATEILEYLNLDGPLTPSDIEGAERASRGRFIRTLGIVTPRGDGTTGGMYIPDKSMAGLRIPEDSGGISLWGLNLGQSMTTGATMVFAGQFYLEWDS